ncbi:MAG: 30S ribosomal protein S16 [Bacteroidetes bacterium SW_4_67_19]|nr:MAG: 30S ribosomal protein S16 [Bacteroidetes bacterium SW_4_67_19]
MPVTLRLRRIGRRKRPVWAVVAADNRRARDGRYIEDLGRYYPLEQPSRTELDEERVMHWLEQGAQPSDTVRSMLSKRGLMLAMDLRRQGKDPDEIREAVAEHREKHGEGDEDVALTAADRRQQALEAERERVAELEAEEERRRKEEEERKRREAEEEAAAEAAEDEEAAADEESAEAADEEAEAAAAEAQETDDEQSAEATDADEAEASAADTDASEDPDADDSTDENADAEEDEEEEA